MKERTKYSKFIVNSLTINILHHFYIRTIVNYISCIVNRFNHTTNIILNKLTNCLFVSIFYLYSYYNYNQTISFLY